MSVIKYKAVFLNTDEGAPVDTMEEALSHRAKVGEPEPVGVKKVVISNDVVTYEEFIPRRYPGKDMGIKPDQPDDDD